MKWLLLVLLVLTAIGAAAEVYKCTAANGRTVYSQIPCDKQSIPFDLQDTPASVIGGGLRDSEKQLLEGLQQQDALPEEDETAPIAAPAMEQPRYVAQCDGINIIDFRPYSNTVSEPLQRDVLDGRLYYGASKMQCARVETELPGYLGRLNISNTAQEIARRLYAQFADGVTVSGEEGSIAEGDNRFARNKSYSGNFCFGISREPITDLNCR